MGPTQKNQKNMEGNRNKLLLELGARVVHYGSLKKSPPSTNLDACTFKRRMVKLLCVTNEGFKKLFNMSKKQSKKYFGSEKNAIVYCLCYWKNDEISPIRVISLEGCFIGNETNSEITTPGCFILVTKKRKFYFQASSEEEKKEWVEIINNSLRKFQVADESNYYEEAQKYPEESNCVFLSLKSNKSQKSHPYVNATVSKPCEQLCKKQSSNEHFYEEIPQPKSQRRILTAEPKEPDYDECDSGLSSRSSTNGSEHNLPTARLSKLSNDFTELPDQLLVPTDPEAEEEVLEEKQLSKCDSGVWSRSSSYGYECHQTSMREEKVASRPLQRVSTDLKESDYDIPELDRVGSISNNVCRPVQEENISARKNEGYIQMKNEEATGDYSYAHREQIYNDDSDIHRTCSARIGKTPVPTPRLKIKRALTDSECELRKRGDREVKTNNCKMSFGDIDIEFNVDHCEANVNGKQVTFSTSIVGFVKKDNILIFPHLRITCNESSGMSIKSCSSQEVVLDHEKDHIIKITMLPVPTYV